MKKSVLIFLFLALTLPLYVTGLDVDRAELSFTKDTAVEFINYEGPHSKIETLEEIMGIGKFLGNSLGDGANRATYAGKYRVIHAADDSTGTGLNADIFILLPGAEVDHIRNVRYMMAGFLIAAYDYALDDALLLAEFVTIYNAVYRGKMAYFGEKYKPVVISNLNAGSAGISTLYTDWAGKTEMVIPLTDGAENGGLGSLDTDALTEDDVIEEMRTQDDRGLDSRKDMTELKEREVEEKQQELEDERQAIDTERERVDTEREQVESERERIDREQETADTAVERDSLARQDAELDRQDEALADQEESLQEREHDLADREQEQAERVEQIQQEREDIVTDERELREQEAASTETEIASATGARGSSRIATFIEVRSISGESLGRIVHLDGGRGVVVRSSTVNSIRNNRFESMGPAYVVVAGTTAGQGAVRLMTIDQETLDTGREGEVDIYGGSFLLVDGSSVYAVMASGDTWKLGKFDSGLVLRQESEIEVFQDTAISVLDDTVFVVGADGAIHSLSASDLADNGIVQ